MPTSVSAKLAPPSSPLPGLVLVRGPLYLLTIGYFWDPIE